MPRTLLGYMVYRAVDMQVFGSWFCWFVDFPLDQCVAVLNVFRGTEA
jgi:hypothetical protein